MILTKDYGAKEDGIACVPLWKWLLERERRVMFWSLCR